MARTTCRLRLHQAQADCFKSPAVFRGYVGGRGAGKSYLGALDLLCRASQRAGRLYGLYAPTYPLLRDTSLRSLLALAKELGIFGEYHKTEHRLTLVTGSEIIGRSLEDPESARGPNLSGAWMDEASLIDRMAWDIIIASLREGGEQGGVLATFTPKGRRHWTYEVFGQGARDTAIFCSRTRDNPFLPDGFADRLASQYTSAFAAQEIEGRFVDLEGGVVNRSWFAVKECVPDGLRRHRHWDLAASEKSITSSDPDFTAGALLGVTGNGPYWLLDMVRTRVGPASLLALIRRTAEMDGRQVPITIEQEPGAGGKFLAETIIRELAGWDVRAVPATGDKLTRAMPWLRQAEIGNLLLRRGEWVRDFLDEAAAFPKGAHDDQVDAVSGAFAVLAGGGVFGAVAAIDGQEPREKSAWEAY